MKPTTVYDVAARAGVSIATVSRVIHGPDAVKPATRERVEDAVKALGYVPSANARGLANRRTNVIGLFLPGHDDLELTRPQPVAAGDEVQFVTDDADTLPLENLYFDEVLRGAEIEAWRQGYALMVAAGRGTSRDALLNDLAGRVDGLAVLASTVSDELLTHVARRIPVVVMADTGADSTFDHVAANNRAGMRAITLHALTHNPDEVIYLAGPGDSPDDAERFAGFENAMGDKKYQLKRGDFSRESGAAAMQNELLVRTTAVICANDQMALGVLDVLEARSIQCPQHVVVTGFDGIVAGKHSRPTLTTVHQPMVELGRAAIHAITARLDDPTRAPQNLTLPVKIVLRASCP